MEENTNTSRIPVEENESFDLNRVLARYFYNWYWFALSIFVFMVVGFLYAAYQSPVYEIKGKILIKENVRESGGANNSQANGLNGFDLFSSDKVLDNEIELLQSNTFLESTIKQLHLQVNVLYKKGLLKKDLYGDSPVRVEVVKSYPEAFEDYINLVPVSQESFRINGKLYNFNTVIYTPYGIFVVSPGKSLSGYYNKNLLLQINDMDDLVDNYHGNLTVEQSASQGTVLALTIKDQVPQRGVDFINKLEEVYTISSINDKNAVTSSSLKFIVGRIDSISMELNGVEKNVEQYKSNNKIADISSQSRIYLENQQQNDAELNKVLIQLNVLQNLEDYLNSEKKTQLPSTLGLDDPTLTGLVKQLSDVLNNKESLLRTIPESNPIIASLDDQIASLKKAVYAGVVNIKSGLLITRNRLQGKANQFQSSIQTVPLKERGLLDVMRQQEIKNNLFIYLLEKREEVSLALASNVSNTRIVDTPRSSKHPVKPRKTVIYLVFAFLGLVFPALILFIKDVLNYRISSRLDIERITRIPIIAEIAYSRSRLVLAPVEKPRSIVSEQIRALRTNLLTSSSIIPKTLLFTSSISGEGKSFISLNIGSSLVSIGKKVLIIELDMRKPKLHINLGMRNEPGLSDYLNNDIDYKSVIQPIAQQENYSIITCGTIPPNPAELLNNTKLQTLMNLVKEDFDHIILDAPPVGLVTDAQILEKYADSTIFLVRYKYTSKALVQMINRLFVEKKFKNMHIILNSLGVEGQGYGYGNGYGYYDTNEGNSSPWYKKLFNK